MIKKAIGIAITLIVAALFVPTALDTMADQPEWGAENTAIIENESLGVSGSLTYTGSFANDHIIYGSVDITPNQNLENIDIDYTDGTYELEYSTATTEAVEADYEYATSWTDWDSGVSTLLKVLLPVVFVIAIVLAVLGKYTNVSL